MTLSMEKIRPLSFLKTLGMASGRSMSLNSEFKGGALTGDDLILGCLGVFGALVSVVLGAFVFLPTLSGRSIGRTIAVTSGSSSIVFFCLPLVEVVTSGVEA